MFKYETRGPMFCISGKQFNARIPLWRRNIHFYSSTVWITIAGKGAQQCPINQNTHHETSRILTRQIKCFRGLFALTKQIHLGKRAHWKLLEREANSRQSGRVALQLLTRLMPRPVGGKTTTYCFYFEYKKRRLDLAKLPLVELSVCIFF